MTIVSIPQFEAFLAALKDVGFTMEDVVAAVPAAAKYGFAELAPDAEGRAALKDATMNFVAAAGGTLTLALPAAVSGRSRDFVVRVVASASTKVVFEGEATYEADDDGVFASVAADSTVVFFLSEHAPGVFLVSRKTVATVEQE